MSKCPFCNLESEQIKSDEKPPAGIFRRVWKSIQWIFPATLLALMPKCPFCVMAYIALFTGIGISVTAARWIQGMVLVLCLSVLAYVITRNWRNRAKARVLAEADVTF